MKSSYWILAALFSMGCATPKPGSEIDALLAREVDSRPEITLAAPDGSFRLRAMGALIDPFEVDAENGVFGLFDIGTGTAAECWFYSGRRDLASSLQRISNSLFELIADAGKVVDAKAIYGIDAGAVEYAPYLSLSWFVRLGSTGALMKQMMGHAGPRSVWCLHDQVGYSKTFERFFLGMLGSLTPAEAGPEPEFTEIVVVSIAGKKRGFSQIEMTRDAEGDTRIVRTDSLLLQTGPDALVATDGTSIEWSRPDGSLINGVEVEAEGGEVVTHLEISRAEGPWRVTGVAQGKPLEVEFTTDEPLMTVLGEYRAYRDLVTRPDTREIRFLGWLASNPTEAVECTLTRKEQRDDGTARVQLIAGPMEIELELDARGARHGSLSMGRLDVQMTRAAQRGSF